MCWHGAEVAERVAAAGGVPEALVGALRAVLTDADVDGALVAATISLPSSSELIDDIPGVDPIVLHEVRRVSLTQSEQWGLALLLMQLSSAG